jgi:secondary thiamine-phosphate synthase enzyme
MVTTKYIQLSTQGNAEVIDITSEVNQNIKAGKIKNGIVNINVIGSTGALSTCEFEPGLVQDIKDIFDTLIPAGPYNHDKAWGDGNGHSHLRSTLIGPSLTLPFNDKKLILGTWQQIIFIDFDNRARERKIVLQIMGE